MITVAFASAVPVTAVLRSLTSLTVGFTGAFCFAVTITVDSELLFSAASFACTLSFVFAFCREMATENAPFAPTLAVPTVVVPIFTVTVEFASAVPVTFVS
ncbi:Uncharacterised protein [Streptococcus pneumoniae]|nr:Uncharacterised protein [Streptococcus pneumoniae]